MTNMSETHYTLFIRWMSILVFSAVIAAAIGQKRHYENLEREYAQYREASEQTVGYLSNALDSYIEKERVAAYKRKVAEEKAAKVKEMFLSREIDCMAQNIYFESGFESYQGKLAVATVTMNRVNSKLYPKTVCGVVHQKYRSVCQFSWTCDGKPDVIGNRQAYMTSLKIAKDVLLKNARSSIIGNKAYHYHANYVRPRWAYQKQHIATIGNHIFYGR